MRLDTTDLVFLGKNKQFSFLCTAGIKANSGICANINAFTLEFGSGGKNTHFIRIPKELAHLIKSLVIFNKFNKLDWYNVTEGQQVCSAHKEGEKRLDNLDLNSMQSFSTNFEGRIKHGGKYNKMLHGYSKSSLHYTKLFRSTSLNTRDREPFCYYSVQCILAVVLKDRKII